MVLGQKPDNIENVIFYNETNRDMVASPLDIDETTAWGVVDDSFSSYFLVNDWDIGGTYATQSWAKVEKAPTIVFNKEYTMNYFVIAQVENANGTTTGNINKATITYWDSGDNRYRVSAREVITRKDSQDREYTVIKLAEPITTKKVNIGVSSSFGRITYAEMRFYEYDELEKEITDLFTDHMHLELKPDVKEENIKDLEDRVNAARDNGEPHPETEALLEDLSWARQILTDNIKAEVLQIDTSVTEAKDGHITFRSGLNAWQPLGITAYEGEKITIYVGNPNMVLGQSTNLQLIATQYHAEASDWFKNCVMEGTKASTLKIGKNEIIVPKICSLSGVERGGSLYINYIGNNSNDEYAVRVTGGTTIPVLDLTKCKDESAKRTAVEQYVRDLKTHVESLETKHGSNHVGKNVEALVEKYNEQNCIANATEIVLDQMMYSVAAKPIYDALKLDTIDTTTATNQLYNSLKAMDDMIDLFYQHKGLSKLPADQVGTTNVYPASRLNIRYHRMFDGAFMYAGGKHIGIEYGSVGGLANGVPINAGDDGKYQDGNYFGWGIAHEIGHIINEGAYTVPEVTNNYFSVLSQAKETNESVRFEYDKVYDKVTSGVKGRSSNVFTQLGLYWQLHLAYDEGYNFKMYDTREEQLENLIFARMDTYAREIASNVKLEDRTAPRSGDNTLTYEGADTDNKLMRLACAGAQKNLLEFFERWGMEPDAETIEYASQFDLETRPIYYITDEARAYQLENGPSMNDKTKVKAEFIGDTTKPMKEVKIKLSLENESNIDAMLGYEITRSYSEPDTNNIEESKTVTRVVAFVPISGNSDIIYTDTINSITNRVFTYSVKAVDKTLKETAPCKLEPIKVSDDGSINKEKWTIDTNMTSEDDKWIPLEDNDELEIPHDGTTSQDVLCEPAKEKAISKIIDGKPGTNYTGSINGNKGEIIISLGSTEKIVALKYNGDALTNMIIEVSTDTNDYWTKVSETEITGEQPTTVYFNLEEKDDGKLYSYDASYVRITIETESDQVNINEIDLLGETGDNVELEHIGTLQTEFKYAEPSSGDTGIIPQDSLVIYGTYKGSPAYNVVILRDENGDIIEGQSIILATEPVEGTDLGEIYSGQWIYWITPEQLEARGVSISDIAYQVGTFFEEIELNDELDLEDPNFEYVEETPPSFEYEDNGLEYTEQESTSGENLNNENDNLFNDDELSLHEDENSLSGDELTSDDDNVNFVEGETLNDDKNNATGNIKTYIGLPTKIKAELYRVNDATTNEGARFVSDTMYITVPEPLPNVSLEN